MAFSISFGGKKKKKEENKEVNMVPFETCKHRSETEVECERHCCGGRITKYDGYRCYKLSIQGLSAQICEGCGGFEPKEIIKKEEIKQEGNNS